MKENLQKGTLDKLWNNPQNWRGKSYFCKDDPRLIVFKRPKWLGWTVNTAHKKAKILMLGIAVTGIAIFTILKDMKILKTRMDSFYFVGVILIIISALHWFLASPKRHEEK